MDWSWLLWVIVIDGAAIALFFWFTGGSQRTSVGELKRVVNELRTEKNALIQALVDARLEIDKLRTEIHQMKSELASHGIGAGFSLVRKYLLMAVSGEPGFGLDLAAARAVQSVTGLTVRRLTNVTFDKLQQALDRARMYNRPVELVHLGVHSSPAGLMLGNEVIGADRLSAVMDGVKVLLLAGCQSDSVGDFMGVVPYVVTITEDVKHEDAARFSQAFWQEIASGQHPSRALERALERAPGGMSEYVERHW